MPWAPTLPPRSLSLTPILTLTLTPTLTLTLTLTLPHPRPSPPHAHAHSNASIVRSRIQESIVESTTNQESRGAVSSIVARMFNRPPDQANARLKQTMVGSQPGNGPINLGWQCVTLRPDGLPCDFKGGFNAQSAPRSLRSSGIFETADRLHDDNQRCS